ncbi:DUF2147 domain-containing protein [Brumimicrobium salinarum]|uniref:DUF2147 domain-containing protein n=1 Tax=Brumimicrobium salinarum TaxID=2058658 RepID=A0A2I0R2I7_9FLAO|nr:DUF2147 domain-containing protein [Brumimicrobium salinarum]PKR80610.1 DUF2147 domain-containing protein [Brumimicrobium salinarum]
MRYILALLFGIIFLHTNAQSIEGIWETYDDESGQLKSEVKIYLKDGKLYGKIVELHNLNIPISKAKCYDCTDYRKDQPVIGMEIMSGLTKDGKYWTADDVLLDPNNGKVYDAKIWLMEDNKLAVRGYLGWFYRTQYWKRK